VVEPEVPSWGNYPQAEPRRVETLAWRQDQPSWTESDVPILAYGLGRSYGDVCLNKDGTILRTHLLDHILFYDHQRGIIRVEAGMCIGALLELIVPRGWFVPVTPGTQFVTLGGAVANDIHGKNHHRVGTFGRHVRAFELVRSDGSATLCTPLENTELFAATIGGLGLTGLITWVEFQLLPIVSRYLKTESVKARTLEQAIELTEASDVDWDYTVTWIDVTATGRGLGKGLVQRGNFLDKHDMSLVENRRQVKAAVPFMMPNWLLNNRVIETFNTAYYGKQRKRVSHRTVDMMPFFYPLDAIHNWNRLYGKRGMLQYQCAMPIGHDDGVHRGARALRRLLKILQHAHSASFLAVVKMFGDLPSPGMMSFPRPGITLSLDMPYSERTLRALSKCDGIVLDEGGRIYPAKDARMSAATFRTMYPEAEQFAAFIDPAFSSSFWRRVWTNEGKQ